MWMLIVWDESESKIDEDVANGENDVDVHVNDFNCKTWINYCR